MLKQIESSIDRILWIKTLIISMLKIDKNKNLKAKYRNLFWYPVVGQ
jgi:hypothetical protein